MDNSAISISYVDSIDVSETTENVESSSTSSIAQYCREPTSSEPERVELRRKIYYCSLCTIEAFSAISTTDFRYHLRQKHQILSDKNIPYTKAKASQQLIDLWQKASSDQESSALDSLVLKSVLNKEVINQALVNLIVVRNLSFRAVGWPELHVLCQALNPESTDYLPTSHSVISSSIEVSYDQQKDIIRKKVQSALTDIHLSVNIWTSPNNYLLLGICAHFMDHEETQTKALLALRTVRNDSGEEQWRVLLLVLQEYGIVKNIGSIVADNSTTNDTLCRAISQYLEINEGIQWVPAQKRVRCHGHTINLIVQAFLFKEKEFEMAIQDTRQDSSDVELTDQEQDDAASSFRTLGVLCKLHNIIVSSRSSSARAQEFKNLAGRMIPLDNSTRWNSWYQMIHVALNNESAIDKYVKAQWDSLEMDYLSPQDWKSLEMIYKFLQPFQRATLESQGDHATLDKVLFTIDILGKHMEKFLTQHRSNKDIYQRVQKALKKFEEYYRKTDQCPLYAAAMILDPNRRLKYARMNWKKDYQKTVLPLVEELWKQFRDSYVTTNLVAYEIPMREAGRELDEFDRIADELSKNVERPASQDEYKDYCAIPPYETHLSPIQWWCDPIQKKRWPRLSDFAINILSIPAMSDEPERIFSGGRRTVSLERMQMGKANLERTECMKSWHSSGILKDEAS